MCGTATPLNSLPVTWFITLEMPCANTAVPFWWLIRCLSNITQTQAADLLTPLCCSAPVFQYLTSSRLDYSVFLRKSLSFLIISHWIIIEEPGVWKLPSRRYRDDVAVINANCKRFFVLWMIIPHSPYLSSIAMAPSLTQTDDLLSQTAHNSP